MYGRGIRNSINVSCFACFENRLSISGHGVLILYHMSALITKFYMIFNPAKYDQALIIIVCLKLFINLHQLILGAKNCHIADAVTERCCTKIPNLLLIKILKNYM